MLRCLSLLSKIGSLVSVFVVILCSPAIAQENDHLGREFARLAKGDGKMDIDEYLELQKVSPSSRLRSLLRSRFRSMAHQPTSDPGDDPHTVTLAEFKEYARDGHHHPRPVPVATPSAPDVFWPEDVGVVLDVPDDWDTITVWVYPPWASGMEYEVSATIVPATQNTPAEGSGTVLDCYMGEFVLGDLQVSGTGETLDELKNTGKNKLCVWIREKSFGAPNWGPYSQATTVIFHAHTCPYSP